ncbi:YggS family pyridoxal phosphate-dependent enzyme [Actinomadura sp. SCN-SB]|uniref:YggS family pyridoxal phosphate-dependent enzyme n=1 Tax=Actinomadura sp. SCN-SB TaxID=3373092 RepID=UPI003750F35C
MSDAPPGGAPAPAGTPDRTPDEDERRAELAANLASVRRRIDAACADAGRDPAEITLIAVTKTFPASDVRLLASLGVTDVGENRDQEAAPKAAATADLPLTWHFVGQLQTNKVRSVASYADVVQSVDRPRLVRALSSAAVRAGRTLRCLIQVSLDGPGPGRHERGGVPPEDAVALAGTVAAADGLVMDGVMAVAPLGADPLPAFRRLAEVAAEVRAAHPGARVLSAGMSGDLEAAIACGATHLRVGTALLGGRRAIVR